MVACLIDPDAEVCYAPETGRSIGYNPTSGNCRRSLTIPRQAFRAARRRGMSLYSLDGRVSSQYHVAEDLFDVIAVSSRYRAHHPGPVLKRFRHDLTSTSILYTRN